MAGGGEQTLDASNIAPRLWVGGRPPYDRDLPDFDMLVLCAEELQPPQLAFHGAVVRCPIPDGVLTNDHVRRVVIAARLVADSLVAGRRVLVTCAAGLNRSVLVASVALSMITARTADQLIRIMRQRRAPNALFNAHFQELLRQLAKPTQNFRCTTPAKRSPGRS